MAVEPTDAKTKLEHRVEQLEETVEQKLASTMALLRSEIAMSEERTAGKLAMSEEQSARKLAMHEDHQRSIEKLRGDCHELGLRSALAVEKVGEKISELEASVAKVREELGHLETAVSKLEQWCGNCRGGLDTLMGRVDRLIVDKSVDPDTLATQATAAMSTRSDKSHSPGLVAEGEGSPRSKLEALEARTKALDEKVATWGHQIHTFAQLQDGMVGEREVMTQRILELDGAMTSQLATLTRQVAQLEICSRPLPGGQAAEAKPFADMVARIDCAPLPLLALAISEPEPTQALGDERGDGDSVSRMIEALGDDLETYLTPQPASGQTGVDRDPAE